MESSASNSSITAKKSPYNPVFEPFTHCEQKALLRYCESDVLALEQLLTRVGSKIDWPRALLRGRYMTAAARIEHSGVPIDMSTLNVLRNKWSGIRGQLIEKVDQDFGVFDGQSF
ncbi:MAG TPA: hypothetical protein PKN33_03865 [Phycisphaerae bacterium]|nr:hypothetical protein [Phycisphaerae bacterium]